MKNKLILILFSFCILLAKDFDLLMSIYTDVFENNVAFNITPNKIKEGVFESQPIPFYFLLDNDFVSYAGERSFSRFPYHYKDSIHLNESVLAGQLIPGPQKMVKESILPINDSTSQESRLSLFKYNFSSHLDSMIFVSNNFKNDLREFNIQFFSIKNSSSIRDSIYLKIDFYIPKLDSVDIKFYVDYSKEDFQKLSNISRKNISEPISTIVRIPSEKFRYASALKVNYNNPNNLILVNLISDNFDTAESISKRIIDIPVIILVSILAIMLIFIGILVFKQFNIKESI
tara:strand:+ start:6316 stop:7179 length:864 start_codon:yes stop_codon:yes gene_type:complete